MDPLLADHTRLSSRLERRGIAYEIRDTSSVKGNGGFATRKKKPGEPVVSFVMMRMAKRRPYRLTYMQVIHDDDRGLVYYDDMMLHSNRTPHWYFINHSSHPNLVVEPTKETVVFTAIPCIPKGHELTFDYGTPSPDSMD